MFRTLLLLLTITGNAGHPLAEIESVETPKWGFEKELLSVAFIPTQTAAFPQMNIEADAAIAMDPNSAFVLYEKNPHLKLPIASLTKIMTAILILEEHDLDEIVSVEFNPLDIEGKKMGLYQNENISVYNLLAGLLITSGNDAAVALAKHNAGTVASFAEKMSVRAKELGLKNTHFTNPVGFDDPKNYSTAHDLSVLTSFALKKPTFRSLIRRSEITLESEEGLSHTVDTTNMLLNKSYLNISGVKTGTTDGAGECFISLSKTRLGNEILTVVLNSPNRFQETKGLIDIVINNNII